MAWDDDLRPPHLDIARSDARTISVLAGPGTGKTQYGLVRRVARLIEEGVDPHSILLISFTRTAARDLADKVAALDTQGTQEIMTGTLHGYCFGLLQREGVLRITQRVPRTLLKHEVDLMLRDLNGNFGGIRECRKKLNNYEAGWLDGTNQHPGIPPDDEDQDFQAQVIRWLVHHKSMLIGEVVPIAYKYLETNPLSDARTAFRYIIVDEYQDLNYLEQKMLTLLASQAEASLCIAGDEDQSIYAFRNAHPTGILDFHSQAEFQVEITKSGRSPEPILGVANSLISNAATRGKAPMEALSQTQGEMHIVQWDSLEAEADGITAAIAHDINTGKYQPGEILILTPRYEIGEGIKSRLLELDIEAHSYFTEEVLKSKDAQEALALLCLLCDLDDRVALRVVLGTGSQDGYAGSYKRLRKLAQDNSISEREALDKVVAGELSSNALQYLIPKYQRAKAILADLGSVDLTELTDKLFPEDNDQLRGLRVLAQETSLEAVDVREWRQAIISKITQPEVPQNPSFVRIMTLHKSKGLTSKCVYILGVLDGLLPSRDDGLSEQEQVEVYEEARRLMYVGVTRASSGLVLSYPKRLPFTQINNMRAKAAGRPYMNSGTLVANTIASPFIAEMGSTRPAPRAGITWISEYTNV